MIHDRLRIVFAQFHACVLEYGVRCGPGGVEVLVGQIPQHRQPAADIGAIGIELLPLPHGIEDAEVGGGIRAGTGDPLPARGIVGQIGIDERIPEPVRAMTPVDREMLDQERAKQLSAQMDLGIAEALVNQFTNRAKK